MTKEELKKLWDEIQKDEDVPWEYTRNCCQSRAHRMAEIANKLSLEVKKVCVEPSNGAIRPVGPDGKPLRYPGELGEIIVWDCFHVAIIVEVEISDGTTEEWVIDPALCPEGPVPLDKWLDKMGGKKKLKVKEHSADVYYPGEGDADGKKTKERLESHRASHRAAIIKYINDNPGILDLPSPGVDPTAGGILCMVNRVTEIRGDDFATVRFGGIGNLRVLTAWDGGETVEWLRSYGLHRQHPVIVWFSQKSRALAFVTPAQREKVLDLRKGEAHLRIVTICPSSFLLSWEHPRYRALHRLVGRSLRTKEELLIVTLPGSRDVIDIVPAQRFDKKVHGFSKKE